MLYWDMLLRNCQGFRRMTNKELLNVDSYITVVYPMISILYVFNLIKQDHSRLH